MHAPGRRGPSTNFRAQALAVTDPLADLAQLAGVPSAIAAATAAVDVVLRDRGLRAVTDEQRGLALAASAQANANLTGAADRWLAGALRLSAELRTLAAVIRVAPGQALARAHALAARGQVPDGELGRLVDDPGVGARMSGLNALLGQPDRSSAIILGAIVHAEIATARPFREASGLVARFAEHLVLVSAGLDPHGVIVVEAGHLDSGPAYGRALTAYAEGSITGVRDWIRHCAAAIGRGAELSPSARR
jgi:hypothetical protein